MEEQEHYLLITRYLSKQTSTEENEVLADWIAASFENEQIFEEIKTIWQLSRVEEESGASAALYRLKDRIRQAETDAVPEQQKKRKWYAIAASVVGFLAFAGLLGQYITTYYLGQTGYIQQVTKAGEKKTFILEDGTKVCLAPQSAVKYPAKFSKAKRILELEGQAYFEVSKNPHRPFVVHTSTLNVQVLGTHFNVSSYKRQNLTTVSLLEGKVNVTLEEDDTEEYSLKPGQELSFNHLSHQVYQHALDSTAVTGWMTNTLVFKNEKLSDAAKRIEQMYNVKIVFADQATADARLYAKFKNDSLKNVLETIQSAGNINYRIEANRVYLTLNDDRKQK